MSTASGRQLESEQHAEVDLAILVALGQEARPICQQMVDLETLRGRRFTEHLGRIGDQEISVIQTGPGADRAATATEDVIRVRRPRWIISAGLCGGLSQSLEKYDLLLPETACREDPDAEDIAVESISGLRDLDSLSEVTAGRVLTVDRAITESDEKRRLGEEHSCLAVDMESYDVLAVCRERGVRGFALRIVSDQVDETLPASVAKMIETQSTARRVGLALGSIFRKPQNAERLWRLQQTVDRAAEKLAGRLAQVAAQLPLERRD